MNHSVAFHFSTETIYLHIIFYMRLSGSLVRRKMFFSPLLPCSFGTLAALSKVLKEKIPR